MILIRILSFAVLGVVVGVPVGAFTLSFLFALTCLPNITPTDFMACLVMFGYVGCARIGAAIGALVGLVAGVVKGSKRPDRSKAEGRQGIGPRDDDFA